MGEDGVGEDGVLGPNFFEGTCSIAFKNSSVLVLNGLLSLRLFKY